MKKVYCKNCIYYARAVWANYEYGTYCPIPVKHYSDWYSDKTPAREECEFKNKKNNCKDYQEPLGFWRSWFKR